MSETVGASILGLVDRIDAIERETESIYLRLGQVFTAVKQAVDVSSRDAETAIAFVLERHRGGVSIEAAKRKSEDFIEDATRFFEKALHSEQVFMYGVENGIESLSKLDEIIGRIREDSEEMEIVSINAMTVALKSGAAGRAFSVITEELKRLSGRTIKHADELSQAGSAMLDRLGTLRTTLASLTDTQSSFFESARSALDRGFISLDADVEETANAIRDLSSESSSVRQPVSDIMQEVQLQDIIRQSLDHVRLSLMAAETEEATEGDTVDPDEERAFLSEITRLSSSLLDDVSYQVRSSLGRFKEGMRGVDLVMSSVKSKRVAMDLARQGLPQGNDYEAKAKAYLKVKEEATADASAITDGVKRLDERFKSMNAILARFKSIVTASRIETARNKALAIVSTTVTGMMDLTDRLTADVAAAGAVTRSFGKTLSTGMADYLLGASDSLEALRSEMSGLRDEFARIGESRKKLIAAESDFKPFSESFSEAIREATASVARIESLAVELEGMRDALLEYAGEADSLGLAASASSIHSERLKSIVDRFTIFAHKQTAARIASIDAGENDSSAESGDVTLF